MASPSTTSSRLRKTFRYPDSDDDDEDLDEEHQERLIEELRAEDRRRNEFYRKAFTAIPFLATLFLLWYLVTGRTARERTLAVVGMSSLWATGWVIWRTPVVDEKRERRNSVVVVESPLEKYLPVMNGVLSGVLGLAGVVSWRQGRVEEAMMGILPAAILGLGVFVRWQLRSVDLGDLEGRKYGLKGA
ncbi:Hypothetical predicted protein [Lecanosticta acicola]|uniref:Uncharacterized protein n=1 Tax=Lecanosticta acicola TaxID=111012 RepID=A0AAI9EED3_9PEZI|nr:Hypothetical predicted protein [Lecanosticta acicola]